MEVFAAIDHDHLAGDEGAVVGRQKDHGSYQVLRLFMPLETSERDQAVEHCWVTALEDGLAQGRAGSNAVNPVAKLPHVVRARPRVNPVTLALEAV